MNLRVESAVGLESPDDFRRPSESVEKFWFEAPPSSPQQAALHSISEMLHYPRGHEVIREGKPAHAIYCIVRGMVCVSRLGETGRRQVFALKKPGDMFGLPEGGRYVNSVRAFSAVTLFRMPWSGVKDLVQQHHQIGSNFLNRAIYDLHRAQDHIVTLGQQNVSQRLAQFLLELSACPEFYDPKHRRLELKIRRCDLADYCGTSAEHVSRIFVNLEQRRLVRRITPKVLELLDPQGLRDFCHGQRRS